MRESIAPRAGEVFLQSLGADPAFRDEVLGDLAEEYALREVWDGPRGARRWYYRECFRVAPYLVRGWLRGLGVRGTSRLASVVMIASIATFLLDRTLHLMVRAPIARWIFETPPLGLLRGVGFLAIVWALNLCLGIFGGYIAGRLNRRAPLPAAIALGGVWVTATLVYNALLIPAGSLFPHVIGIANVTMVFAGVAAGGVLAARRTGWKARLFKPT